MSFILINNILQISPYLNSKSLPQPVRRVAITPNNSALTATDATCSICLTFDDGPDPLYTPQILQVLADYNVKATFFVLGEAAERYPYLVEQMHKAGHSIGNHTYSHQHPWMISSERAKQEVTQANAAIKNITGIAPRWFRPPFGRLRTAMRMQAHAEQMVTVLWSHSIIDWGMFGTKAGIARRLDNVESGDIVLMHDGRPQHNHPGITARCLPQFLRSLADKSLTTCNLDSII